MVEHVAGENRVEACVRFAALDLFPMAVFPPAYYRLLRHAERDVR
jgi:hypothetical protein